MFFLIENTFKTVFHYFFDVVILLQIIFYLKLSFVLKTDIKTCSGLPHGQEKSGKTKKDDNSQENSGKMGVFEKSKEKILKHQLLSNQIYQIPYIKMPLSGIKLIKNSLNSN